MKRVRVEDDPHEKVPPVIHTWLLCNKRLELLPPEIALQIARHIYDDKPDFSHFLEFTSAPVYHHLTMSDGVAKRLVVDKSKPPYVIYWVVHHEKGEDSMAVPCQKCFMPCTLSGKFMENNSYMPFMSCFYHGEQTMCTDMKCIWPYMFFKCKEAQKFLKNARDSS